MLGVGVTNKQTNMVCLGEAQICQGRDPSLDRSLPLDRVAIMASSSNIQSWPFDASAAHPAVPRVAVLLSGRWFGRDSPEGWQATRDWSAHLMRHLVVPNKASIFLVTSCSNWCGARPRVASEIAEHRLRAAEDELRSEALEAFEGWDAVRTAVIRSEEEPALDGRLAGAARNALVTANLSGSDGEPVRYGATLARIRGWRWQFAHFARAEALRRVWGPHELIVRTRLDLQFESTVDLLHHPGLHASASSVLFAVGFHASPSPLKIDMDRQTCHASPANTTHPDSVDMHDSLPNCPDGVQLEWHWRDWIFIGGERAMAPLASMIGAGVVLSHLQTRCAGMCQEEQTILHLQRMGVTLQPLTRRVGLVRRPCGASPIEPAQRTQPAWATSCGSCSTVSPHPFGHRAPTAAAVRINSGQHKPTAAAVRVNSGQHKPTAAAVRVNGGQHKPTAAAVRINSGQHMAQKHKEQR